MEITPAYPMLNSSTTLHFKEEQSSGPIMVEASLTLTSSTIPLLGVEQSIITVRL